MKNRSNGSVFLFLKALFVSFDVSLTLKIQKMKNFFLSGCIFLSAALAFGQRNIDFIEYDLPNGMHVILHEEHATPIVAVSVLNSKSDDFTDVIFNLGLELGLAEIFP